MIVERHAKTDRVGDVAGVGFETWRYVISRTVKLP